MAWSKYEEYYIFDDPVPYIRKDDDKPLMIHPIRMKDIYRFNYYATCLTVDKNSIPDGKIISMSYLEFLYFSTMKDFENTPYILMFRELLKLCLHRKETEQQTIFFNSVFEKPFFFKIDDTTYYQDDFDEIKRIICDQNMLELPEDSPYDKRTRDLLDEAKAAKAKMNSGSKVCSLENQMVALSIATGMPLENIYNLTVRKFSMALERVDHKINYELTTLLTPYMDSKKVNISHWLADLTRGKYDDVLMELSEVENQVSKANGNLPLPTTK